ncbi:MAG: type II toxin-antitoxin system HicA family toxin [Janthinobacterium lividum]
MDSRTIIRLIEADGWRFKAAVGSHYQFTHPHKKGRVTVQHPRKDVPVGTRKKIEQQAGIVLQR